MLFRSSQSAHTAQRTVSRIVDDMLAYSLACRSYLRLLVECDLVALVFLRLYCGGDGSRFYAGAFKLFAVYVRFSDCIFGYANGCLQFVLLYAPLRLCGYVMVKSDLVGDCVYLIAFL